VPPERKNVNEFEKLNQTVDSIQAGIKAADGKLDELANCLGSKKATQSCVASALVRLPVDIAKKLLEMIDDPENCLPVSAVKTSWTFITRSELESAIKAAQQPYGPS
jgi:hypothetical protein